MGKGGSAQSQPTNQTVTQTNLPEYIRPYVESVAQRAEGISNQPYEAYTGPRIAGFNQDQNTAFGMARGLGATYQPSFQSGSNITGIAANRMQQAGQYNPQSFTADQVGSQDWNSGIASQYMNPYIENVLRRQEALAGERFQSDQTKRDLGRAAAGSFGGYRHGIENAVSRQQFNRGLDDIAAQSLMRGYDTAYQHFGADRGARIQTGIANQQANLEAGRMGEQSRQFGANIGLQSATGLANIGDQLYRQGAMQRDYAGRDMDAMRSVGQQQQDQTQRNMDVAYNDFVNQRDYDRNQVLFLNSIIRGMPVSPNSETTTYNTENPYSNLLGLGIGATGLIKGLQGGG